MTKLKKKLCVLKTQVTSASYITWTGTQLAVTLDPGSHVQARQVRPSPDMQPSEFINIPYSKSVSFLLVGRAGVGKTALGNAVANEDIGTESENLVSETKFQKGSVTRGEVCIEISDTPGLQGNSLTGQERASFLAKLKEEADQCDVIIYCVRMDAVRLEKMDIENIDLISQNLGNIFWNKCVIALTFANLVTCPPSHQSDAASEERWFRKRATDWQTQLREKLYQNGIPESIANQIPLVPVGYNKPTLYCPNPWIIPGITDWLLEFMYAVNNKLGSDALASIVRELRNRAPLPHLPNPSESAMAKFLDYTGGTPLRMRITSGVGGGVGAGVGVAFGAIFSPITAALSGVLGAIGGTVGVYASLTAALKFRKK